MSRLRYPLKDHLTDPTGEEALARVWRGIDARAPQVHVRPRVWAMASVAAAAAAVIVFALFFFLASRMYKLFTRNLKLF